MRDEHSVNQGVFLRRLSVALFLAACAVVSLRVAFDWGVTTGVAFWLTILLGSASVIAAFRSTGGGIVSAVFGGAIGGSTAMVVFGFACLMLVECGPETVPMIERSVSGAGIMVLIGIFIGSAIAGIFGLLVGLIDLMAFRRR
jgi:hypothetical protein